jgi:hypothetical protein
MSQAYSGIQANVVNNTTGVDLDAFDWTGDFETDSFDSTTTADAGWRDVTSATQGGSGSFDFFYNILKKPTGASAGVAPQAIVTLWLWVNKTGGDKFAGPALILKLSLKAKVKEGFVVTASWQSKGAWTYPS